MRWKIVVASILFGIFVIGAGALILSYDKLMYPLKFEEEILSASEEFSVDPVLIASVMNAESRFRTDIVSDKGAVGLMQVLPATAEWVVKQMSKKNIEALTTSIDETDIKKIMYNEETKTGELLDVKTNIRIGTYYLAYLLNKFSTLELALCAYNAGEGTVSSWLSNEKYSNDGQSLDKIPYKETQNYVNKVNLCLKVYEKKFN